MECITIKVYVSDVSISDAEEIANDIHDILNTQGITNSVHVLDEDAE